MSQWRPEPPQGSTTEEGLVIIGRPPIPKFSPPQGIDAGIAPPSIDGDPLLATFPPIGDQDYNKFLFFQVNKGQFPTPQTDFIWEITGSVGPGVFQEASGFDIRPFLNDERDIASARDNNNTFTPLFQVGFILQVAQLSDDQLHLFCWDLGGLIHEWILPGPAEFPTNTTEPDNDFFPIEGDGRDIKFADKGRKMLLCGIDDNIVRLYNLPTPSSFAAEPVLLDSFDMNFLGMLLESADFSVDGKHLNAVDSTNSKVLQFDVTPFTLPAFETQPDREFPYSPQITFSNGNSRTFRNGSAFYLMSALPPAINEYKNTDGNFQIPIINKPPDASFDVSTFDTNPRAMSVATDGTLIWFSGRINDTINELYIPGKLLAYEVPSVSVATGNFTIKVLVPAMVDLTFVQVAVGNAAATDGSTTLGAGTTLSTFETQLFTKDEDNFLVDDQGRNLVAEQS